MKKRTKKLLPFSADSPAAPAKFAKVFCLFFSKKKSFLTLSSARHTGVKQAALIALAVALAAFAAFGAFAYQRTRVTARALSLDWPADLSPDVLRQYVTIYLRRSGWQILPNWTWMGVRTRATKAGQLLNLSTFSGNGVSLHTFLRDASESGQKMGALITVLDYGFGSESEQVSECLPNVMMIRPAELARVADLIKARRKADAEPDAVP